MNNFSEDDWNKFTVLRKTREQQQKNIHLQRQALRDGKFTTQKKQTLGANKSSQSKNDLNTRKLDESSEAQKLKTIDRELSQQIIQARCAKKLTQDALAKQLNLNVSIIKEYETGKAVINNQILQKICRVLCIKINKKK